MTNEYGNGPMHVGIGEDENGVHVYIRHPKTGQPIRVMQLEPEFAREIAMNMTLASYRCEDIRREKKSSGG